MSSPVLSESHTLELAQLEVKRAAGDLTEDDRYRIKQLGVSRPLPSHNLSLGGRAATSLAFKKFASKNLTASAGLALTEDIPLVNVTSGAQTKALITGVSDTSGGAHITNDRGEYAPQAKRRLRVLDMVRLASTELDAVEFARQTTFTNSAAAVAEATSVSTGTKPEATIAFEKVTANVVDYEAWVPATRRALTDASGLRDTIDSQLTFATRRVLEEAVVAGMVAGAGSTQAKGADALPVAVLKLLTTLRNADVEPTAALLNPLDYETIRTLSGTSPYLSGPPITVDGDGTERLFAIPLIVTPSVADDTAVIADMQSVTVWARSLQVFVSQSHASYFTQNLVAILAELRAAFGITATAGIGTVTGWD